MGLWSHSHSVAALGLSVLLCCCCSLAVGAGDGLTDAPYIPKDAYTEYEFPNPTKSKDLEACGVDIYSSVCDPGHSLSKSAIKELNDLIYSLRESETCLCASSDDCRKRDRHSIKIAVVPRIKYVTGSFPTSSKTEISAARQFAEYLRDDAWWTSAWCEMQVFIVYDVYTKRIWTSTNEYAFKVITNDRAKETAVKAKEEYFDNGMVFMGLKDMVLKYKKFLDDGIPPRFNWWQILLIVLAVLTGVGLFVLLIVCAVRHGGGGGGGNYSSTYNSGGGGFWSSGDGGGGGGGGGGGCGGGGGA